MVRKDAACIQHAEPGTLALDLVHVLCQIQVKDFYEIKTALSFRAPDTGHDIRSLLLERIPRALYMSINIKIKTLQKY